MFVNTLNINGMLQSDPEKSCDYEEVDLQGAGEGNRGDATSNSREEVTSALSDALKVLTSSSDLEVQERATVMQQFVKYVGKQLAKAPSDNQLDSTHLEARHCINFYKQTLVSDENLL